MNQIPLAVDLPQIIWEMLNSDSCPRPRVHGNGFIQLDLPPNGLRLHVWGHPKIPCQKVNSQIHDHTFSFRSTVLFGELINRTIDLVVDENGAYDVYAPNPRFQEDTELKFCGFRVNTITTKEQTIRRHEYYDFPAFLMHETLAFRPAISIIEKNYEKTVQPQFPRVLVPHGWAPDNTFNRYSASPALLWGIIHDVVSEAAHGETRLFV